VICPDHAFSPLHDSGSRQPLYLLRPQRDTHTMGIPALMPLQPACGGPLSPPDTFFDLCIAFLPVSGISIFFPFTKKTLLSCFGKCLRSYFGKCLLSCFGNNSFFSCFGTTVFFLISRKNSLLSSFGKKMWQRMLCGEWIQVSPPAMFGMTALCTVPFPRG